MSQNQKSTQAQICFSRTLKVKKTPNMNSPHQMEPFNTNFIRFGGLDWCQRHVSLSTTII